MRSTLRHVTLIALLISLLPLLCGALPYLFVRTTLSQGDGLPSLHRLDWGARYVGYATWSPNGKWIALLAGSDYGSDDVHLEVLTPDGRLVQNLTAWDCGVRLSFTFAWRPDNTLSCIGQQDLVIGAYPFTTAQHFPLHPDPLFPEVDGGAWLPDGQTCLVVSTAPPVPTYGTRFVSPGQLYALSAEGEVTLQPLTPSSKDLSNSAWQPQHWGVSVVEWISTGVDSTGYYNLLLSTVQRTPAGDIKLGPPQTLATDLFFTYAWSPSGKWVAVRHGDYRSGDKIYLVNVANPSQTVDVVVADKLGQQMTDPVWSPDGRQLIVFTVEYGAAHPYAIDIGASLRSKGLQP